MLLSRQTVAYLSGYVAMPPWAIPNFVMMFLYNSQILFFRDIKIYEFIKTYVIRFSFCTPAFSAPFRTSRHLRQKQLNRDAVSVGSSLLRVGRPALSRLSAEGGHVLHGD